VVSALRVTAGPRSGHAAEMLELEGPAWCTVPSFDAEADEMLEECARLNLEGLVAKRVDSRSRSATPRAVSDVWFPGGGCQLKWLTARPIGDAWLRGTFARFTFRSHARRAD